MKPLSPIFTIQQISQKCDVPKSALRFWEKRLDPLFSPIPLTSLDLRNHLIDPLAAVSIKIASRENRC